MRWLTNHVVFVLLVFSLALLLDSAKSQTPPAQGCRTTTETENTALARAWHEDVINRRNPAMLRDILAPKVAHHAAGGYPKLMDESGIPR
jgi:hypothetical protein